jgi:microcystin-dependent protein
MPAPTGRTANNALPYPIEADGADPSRDFQALAEKLDELININALVPIGGEAEWAGENDPNVSWMVENGRAISRTTYKKLFEALGSKYGAGDGVTTFNIPDTRGRVSVGAGTGTGLTLKELAKNYGAETITLTAKQSGLPQHTHPYGSEGEDWSIPYEAGGNGGYKGNVNFSPIRHSEGYNNGFFTIRKNASAPAEESHGNIQPSIAKNKIIRVL